MRVLVVSAWPPWPLTDGAALVLHHHLRLLAARHEVTVLAASRPPTTAGDEPVAVPGPPVAVRWFGPARSGPREYARRRVLGVRRREPADVFRVEVPALLDAFRSELAAARPDVVHLHGWGTAQLARRTGGVPALHVALDAWEVAARTQHPWPWWRRALDAGQPARIRAHERRHYPACGAVVVVAPGDAELLRARVPGARIEVVANGVEAGPDPGPPAGEDVLGFHGVLRTRTNRAAAVALAAEVLPLVRARRPGARALLIGRDPPAAVARLAGPAVEVTGAVPDVRAALARVAVYVAPVRTGSGMKNKILEAMAAGLPVVATPLALDGIGPGPGVVAAPDAGALADAAAALLADPAERRRLGAAARCRVVEEFTWERSAGRIEALWSELAGRPA